MRRTRGTAGMLLAFALLGAACQPSSPAPSATPPPVPPVAAPTGSPQVAPSVSPAASPAALGSPSPLAAAPAAASPSVVGTVPPAGAGTPSSTSTASVPARATLAVALGTAIVAPVALGATRVELVNVAQTAYQGGDAATATQLYDRALNTPPGSDETPPISAAIDQLAHFREMLSVLATGDESGAHDQLDALQNDDPGAPLARLASQFWDQYGMTGDLASACAQLRPQLNVADPTFVLLSQVGVTTQAATLCVPPGQQ